MNRKAVSSCLLREGRAVLGVAVLALLAPLAWAQQGYRKPPKAILDVLDAPVTPQVSVSPTRDLVLLAEPVRYPRIALLAQPMVRLAGLRIDPATNGPHNPPRYVSLTLKRIADGSEKRIVLPPDPYLGFPVWSPDGKHFAFTQTSRAAIELWVGDAATATARKMAGVVLNTTNGPLLDWMPDSRGLLCGTIPVGRGKPPEKPLVPTGPNIQENYGRAAPAPTYQDLLRDAYDEDLFDYYAATQLVVVDTVTAKASPVGRPAIFGREAGDFRPGGSRARWRAHPGRAHSPAVLLPPNRVWLPARGRGLGPRWPRCLPSRQPATG